MADCVRCGVTLRDGAAFCGACGERQPVLVETPEAIARYREVLAGFLADGALDAPEQERQQQLEAVRLRLGVSLATHAQLFGQLAPARPPPPSIKLAIDVSTLAHLAVGERGLVRWQIENEGGLALASVSLAVTLSGAALPPIEGATLFPGRAAVLSAAVSPAVAGFHELAGELRVVDLMGEASRYRFSDIHVRAGGDLPQRNVINIDQSSARVVDNSRSTFGAAPAGGLVGAGDWQPVPLVSVRDPAQRTATTSARRIDERNESAGRGPTGSAGGEGDLPLLIDVAITTDKATYQLTTILARGDIATVYGGHIRDTQQPVAVKLADQASDNDLLQHEARVLGLLLAAPHKAAIHLAPPRDQFRTADGRLGTVFDRLDGFDLTQVRDRCRRRGAPGLPPRHIVWVVRRALAALGWAHDNGILHGNLDPAHILIRPHDHMLWLVDWCWAVVHPATTGQRFKAQNEIYSPPEVGERGHPTPASDLYALGKCAIHAVGGDPATKALPDMDPRLARFLRYLCVESQAGRPQDAWELYHQADRIRNQIWGAHAFVPLEL